MDIKSLVRGAAEVIRITTLHVGDVVKYVKEQSYGEPQLRYAVVMDVMNNGESCVVQLISFKYEYSKCVMESILLTESTKGIALFPATPVEIRNEFSRVEELCKTELSDMKDKLLAKEKAFEELSAVFASDSSNIPLTMPIIERRELNP